jgi:hypothetical protein
MITNTSPLGSSNNVRSLYNQQYPTEYQREQSFKKIIGFAGLSPGPVGKAATVASLASTESNVDPGVVLYTSRKGFIQGAENEINRLDQLIGDASGGYRDFLIGQQDLLKYELKENKTYDAGEIMGIEAEFNKHAIPFPYVDDRSEIPFGNPIDYRQYYNGE